MTTTPTDRPDHGGDGPVGARAGDVETVAHPVARQGTLWGVDHDPPMTSADWLARYREALVEVGRSRPGEPITTDTLRAAGVPEPEACGLHSSLWGAATSAAAAQSMIHTDGRTEPSRRRSRHGGRGLRWWVAPRAEAS
jgi:hypothetical protein